MLLPAIASVVVVVWFFSSVANVTDTLLFFLPGELTHKNAGQGPMYWYWSLAAFVLAVLLISLIGRLTRYYIGKKIIQLLDQCLLRVPLLNKTSPGQRAVGFVTGEQDEAFHQGPESTVSVFIPTTPNPTSGFLILVPASDVKKLNMSVAEGIKFIVSLGAIPPEPSLPIPPLPGVPVSHG